jgi:hypothetical protein
VHLSFNNFVKDGMLASETIDSLRLVCIPIFSVRDDWWFSTPVANALNESDPCVSPFIGLMDKVSGVGCWMRDLQFEQTEPTASTTCTDDLYRERDRTPAGAWVWLEASEQTLCYCNPVSDVHVVCLSPHSIGHHALEPQIVQSLSSSVAQILSWPYPDGREWLASFFKHHLQRGMPFPDPDLKHLLDRLP